jgi:hypothetical protein
MVLACPLGRFYHEATFGHTLQGSNETPGDEDPELPELTPFQSRELAILPGQQRDLVIRPTATRQDTLQTFGVSDTVMVLFEYFGQGSGETAVMMW